MINNLILNQLFRKYVANEAALDSQQNLVNNKAVADTRSLNDARTLDLERLRDSFASRGRTHSGANLESNVKTRQGYDKKAAALKAAQNVALGNIQKQRTQNRSQYELDKATSMMGL